MTDNHEPRRKRRGYPLTVTFNTQPGRLLRGYPLIFLCRLRQSSRRKTSRTIRRLQPESTNMNNRKKPICPIDGEWCAFPIACPRGMICRVHRIPLQGVTIIYTDALPMNDDGPPCCEHEGPSFVEEDLQRKDYQPPSLSATEARQRLEHQIAMSRQVADARRAERGDQEPSATGDQAPADTGGDGYAQ